MRQRMGMPRLLGVIGEIEKYRSSASRVARDVQGSCCSRGHAISSFRGGKETVYSQLMKVSLRLGDFETAVDGVVICKWSTASIPRFLAILYTSIGKVYDSRAPSFRNIHSLGVLLCLLCTWRSIFMTVLRSLERFQSGTLRIFTDVIVLELGELSERGFSGKLLQVCQGSSVRRLFHITFVFRDP